MRSSRRQRGAATAARRRLSARGRERCVHGQVHREHSGAGRARALTHAGLECHAVGMARGDDAIRDEVVLPAPCLVVLVGMSGSGKSTWAEAHFAPEQIVSSDNLRAIVGAGADDITASDDAFALLEQIVAGRTRRRLTTVVDTLGLDSDRRRAWIAR